MFQYENRSWLWSLIWLLMAGMLLLVTACEDDQSAVPPGTVRDLATAVADDAGVVPETSDEFSGLSDAEFTDDPLPLANRIYFAHGLDVWQLPRRGQPSPITDDAVIAGFSSSARGDRLAVLTFDQTSDGRERTLLSIHRPNGDSIFDLSEITDEIDIEQLSTIESVALSPDGDALAMTHKNGGMSLITLDGDVQQLLQPSIEHNPGRMSWSADGRFLAYLDPWMPAEPSALWVAIPEQGERELLVVPSDDEHGVVHACWIPGTSSIAVAKSSGSTIPHGGDLFLINVQTGSQELLMSAGAIAPVAGVVDFASSPDGRWLAVTGFVPGDEYPNFAGLWIINLQSGLRIQANITSGETVTDLWWLGENLLIRTIDEPRTSLPGTYTGREEFTLLEFDPHTGSLADRFPEVDDD